MSLAVGIALLAALTIGSGDSFFEAVNDERTDVGLTAYEWDQNMAFYADKHNEEMVAADKIYHSTASELGQFLGVRVAENVGRGSSVESLMLAFMDSPGHRDAILDLNYTEIGIASLQTDYYLYVTMVFRESVTEDTSPEPVEIRPACCTYHLLHEHTEIVELVVLSMIPPHFLEGIDG